MASLIMHLCVAKNINAEFDNDSDFILGTLLPDFVLERNAHFRDSEGEKRFFNISAFREANYEKIKNDSLYLGYYLHLVQDVAFRKLVYNKYSWNPHIAGNVERLYGDYRKLNSLLAEEFLLNCNIIKAVEKSSKKALKDFIYEPMYMRDCLMGDLENKETGDFFFLTPEKAYEFILCATELCLNEVAALEGNAPHIDEKKHAWNKV